MNTTIKALAMAALAAFTFGFSLGANADPATDVQYFAQCALAFGDSNDEAENKLLNDDWTPVGGDFNASAGGKFIRMGVKYTTDPALAITAFAVYRFEDGGNPPDTFDRDGITFYKIGSGYVDWCPAAVDKVVDLNKEAGGKDLYLYATRDPKAGSCVTAFYQAQNEDQGPAMKDITDRGYTPTCNQFGGWQDCNEGTGDDYLYEGYKGETVYRYPVYNVPGDPTSGVREWLVGSTNATTVVGSSSEVTWSAGWYAVRSDITFSEGAACKGDVHLILCDGAKLTVTRTTDGSGIHVAGEGNALTIYGQALGTGQLVATGKNVEAAPGAGIGGGRDESVYDITINGGKVTATGGEWGGAGIGGGRHAFVSNITINGGEVTATSGDKCVPGIGGGVNGLATNIFVSSSLYVLADTNNPPMTVIFHSSTEDIAVKLTEKVGQVNRRYVRIGPAVTPISTQPIPVEHTTFAVYTNGVLSAEGKAWSNDYATVVYTADEGYAFAHGPTVVTNVLDTMKDPAVNVGGVAPAVPGPAIAYRVPVYRTPGEPTSGIDHWETRKTGVVFVASAASTVTWNAGWYAVTNDVTLSEGAICNGDVHLILCDGANLTATGVDYGGNAAIRVSGDGNALTIYGQEQDTGRLIATGGTDGSLDYGGAGIGGGAGGAGNDITVNGGTVKAAGGFGGAGIGGGYYTGKWLKGVGKNITINGGEVTATGKVGAGIGGGNGGEGRDIRINGGRVTASDGFGYGVLPSAIGGGDGGPATNIFIDGSVLCVKADGNNPPRTPIANDGGDLASKLDKQCYATVLPGGSIDVAAAEHGTAAVVPAANSNETVTVTAKPASDYCLSAISVFKTGEETRQIPLTRTKDNVYTFTMPDYAVTVRTAFAPHPSITGVTAQQRYPWNGMVDIAYDVSVDASDDYALRVRAVDRTTGETAEATALTVGARALSKGAHTLTWDMGAEGIALVSTNVVFIVSAEPRDAVQLWAGGPYFATENVGATQPQDYGCYFWWGDTVGYRRNAQNKGWISIKDGTAFTFDAEHCPPYGKDVSWLTSNGYIDGTGHLVAEHDAATANLGASWRMLTIDEMKGLADTKNCSRTWTVNWKGTGVNGYVVTGATEGYTDRSIFLPAGGFASGSSLSYTGQSGLYWSSNPRVNESTHYNALDLDFDQKGEFRTRDNRARYEGHPLRPVRNTPAPIGQVASGESDPMSVDLRADVVREVLAPETLTYTTNYPGGAVADATVAITVNGETLASGLTGKGTVEWTPTQAGTNELRHIVTAGGTIIANLTARFYVPGVKVGESAFAVTRTGVCELFGVGATYDGTGVLPDKASVTNVVIADGITRVGKDFFADCPGLTTVTGGRDLASVGTNAFCNSPALTAITLDCTEIPEGLGDSVTYRTMLAPDGTIWQVPTISIAGHVETLYGKEKLDDAEWKDLGPLEKGQSIYTIEGYRFFRVRFEKAE